MAREMNEIEIMFYEALEEVWGPETVEYQAPIGIYIADFKIGNSAVIEIDGHEAHKTKEQRFQDYKRERFFMMEGYIVIRFMGSEVYVDAMKCAREAGDIVTLFDNHVINAFEQGLQQGRSGK